MRFVLTSPRRCAETYHVVAEDETVTQMELVCATAAAFERPPPVVISEAEVRVLGIGKPVLAS